MLDNKDDILLTIVGKGFDEVVGLVGPNIKVHGYVTNLSAFYNQADIVLNPIFSGSGMKTKVAEALYYGKPVLSTQMGLSGYDAIIKNNYVYIS